MDYLHTRTEPVVHRDLKPANILLMVDKEMVRVKISDFGISRRIPENRTSLTVRTSSGSEGWRAPEILKLSEHKDESFKMTPATDIFSLGCLFYYVLSEGKHPFGEGIRRQTNILDDISNYSDLENNPKYAAHLTLIQKMVKHESQDRITAAHALQDIMFWSKEKSLSFLVDVSNNVKDKKNSETDDCVKDVEKLANEIIGLENWKSRICPVVLAHLNKRKYDESRVMSLVRAIRDMRHHYADLTTDVKKAVGEVPDHFLDYWTDRFPLLISKMWITFRNLKDSPVHGLKSYYTV